MPTAVTSEPTALPPPPVPAAQAGGVVGGGPVGLSDLQLRSPHPRQRRPARRLEALPRPREAAGGRWREGGG